MTAPRVTEQTTVTPPVEPQNQNQNPDQQNPPSQDNSGTPTQQNQQPSINPDEQLQAVHNLYRQALGEGERERRRLQEELDRRNSQVNNNPSQEIPEDQLTPAQLIERTVQRQVAPLLQGFNTMQQMQELNTYNTIKQNFLRTMPQLATVWIQLEPMLDREMEGKTKTVENVQRALGTVIGLAQMQMLTQPQQNNQPQNQNLPPAQNQPQNPNPQQMSYPPHLRPSAPPLPDRNGNNNLTPGGNPRRPLNELEKRLAREQRPPLTDDQYIDWISVDPTQVVHSQIGVPPRQS
jgi:hypothetical protein